MRGGSRGFGTLRTAGILASLVLACGCGGAGSDSTDETVLVDTQVVVPAGGGGAGVSFPGEAGQRVHIALSGQGGTSPYGFLEPLVDAAARVAPGGRAGIFAPADNGNNGRNEADVTLSATGRYALTVFDARQAGGAVDVLVTVAGTGETPAPVDYSGTWVFTQPAISRENGHYFTIQVVAGTTTGTIYFPNAEARYSAELRGTTTGTAIDWSYREPGLDGGLCAGTIYLTGTFTSPTTAVGERRTGPNGCVDAGMVQSWEAAKR